MDLSILIKEPDVSAIDFVGLKYRSGAIENISITFAIVVNGDRQMRTVDFRARDLDRALLDQLNGIAVASLERAKEDVGFVPKIPRLDDGTAIAVDPEVADGKI